MSQIESCPFCNLKARVLKENGYANLFLSNPRKVEGHFLITPKRHVEKPWELTEKELKAIFGLVFFIQRRLSEILQGGCDVKQNYRPFMKQGRIKVDHVHYHVYPRQLEDELYQKVEKYETDLFMDLAEEEQERVSKLVIELSGRAIS